MVNYQELYTQALSEFGLSLEDGRFPKSSQLTITQRKETIKIDSILTKGVREFLPQFLPFSTTVSNVADSMTGLIFLGEINAPAWIAFHFHRGLYAAVLRMSHPPEVKDILASVNQSGYPTEPQLSRHFIRTSPTRTCKGILSGLEALRILNEDMSSTSRILAHKEDLS